MGCPTGPGDLLLEVWPLPAGRIAGALLEGLEPLLAGRVAADVELELVEGRSQELDLHTGRRLAGLADPSEEARTHEPGEDTQDDDDDEELDQW